MRIFYASDNTPNPAFESNLWRNNLYLPLLDLGHEVVEFDYDLRETFQNLDPAIPEQRAFIARHRPHLSAELLRQVKAAHAAKPLDLFFSYFYDACVLPETIEAIRALGIKTVNWYCNGSYQLHLVADISPHYDWCLVPEKFRLEDYRRLGANPVYCQEAANPAIYHPYDLPYEYAVAFAGQAYGERPGIISYLREQGLDVRVWGYGWERYVEGYTPPGRSGASRLARLGRKLASPEGRAALRQRFQARARPASGPAEAPSVLPANIVGGVLSDRELVKLYSRAKINLGFSSVGETHRQGQRIVQVRLRDFEVPMSGGFYMVEYMEELEEFFEIGREIVCYRDQADLAGKIRYYLAHDEEREAIRRAGLARCLRDHTWQRRLQNSFDLMGL